MLKITIALTSLALLGGTALAAPAAPVTPPPPASAPQPSADGAKGPSGPSGTSDFANQETYKMKDGGMYQPPAQRPASPAQDVSIYGRT